MEESLLNICPPMTVVSGYIIHVRISFDNRKPQLHICTYCYVCLIFFSYILIRVVLHTSTLKFLVYTYNIIVHNVHTHICKYIHIYLYTYLCTYVNRFVKSQLPHAIIFSVP